MLYLYQNYGNKLCFFPILWKYSSKSETISRKISFLHCRYVNLGSKFPQPGKFSATLGRLGRAFFHVCYKLINSKSILVVKPLYKQDVSGYLLFTPTLSFQIIKLSLSWGVFQIVSRSDCMYVKLQVGQIESGSDCK